ncbi:hypothetical protein QF049_001300 [Paenibacillus sp. W4I10]|nr:hypothetical protein [Paenibacillus sp. W4I10]
MNKNINYFFGLIGGVGLIIPLFFVSRLISLQPCKNNGYQDKK